MNIDKLKNLIILSLWGEGIPVGDRDSFEEMKQHAIAALPGPYLSKMALTSELKNQWKRHVLQHVSMYTKYNFIQANLPINVPYVILKGSSAAQYYPYPEYRIMGDIDIMTRRDDLEFASRQLQADGYRIIKELNREIALEKDGIVVELHRRYSTLNDPDRAKYLDDLIITNINPLHVLPDLINGLVLLEHIDQHMEGGIGLRQIIDWMMFVHKCLPDNQWPEFKQLVNNIGLEKLAIVTTRMCEIYLGLPCRNWCKDADEALCKQLMDYVLTSGNFGNKKTTDADISTDAFVYASTPQMALKLLQRQGLTNWSAAKKNRILRPFAWIYQAIRYVIKGLGREQSFRQIKAEYIEAKKRNAMFDALGINTAAKGTVIYKDGQYVKE